MRIKPINSNFRPIVNELIKDEWAGPMIVTKGHAWDTSTLPVLWLKMTIITSVGCHI